MRRYDRNTRNKQNILTKKLTIQNEQITKFVLQCESIKLKTCNKNYFESIYNIPIVIYNVLSLIFSSKKIWYEYSNNREEGGIKLTTVIGLLGCTSTSFWLVLPPTDPQILFVTQKVWQCFKILFSSLLLSPSSN